MKNISSSLLDELCEKEPALFRAVCDGDCNLVESLIRDGADINEPDPVSGYTPLMLAALSGNKKIVDILLKNGAEILTQANDGRAALTASLSYGRTDIADMLINIEPDILRIDGINALIQASYNGNMDIINYLLAKGISVNGKNEAGTTALMAAAQEGYLNIVKLLLKHGAEINIKDNHGKTALFYSTTGGRVCFVREAGESEPTINEVEDALSEKLKLNQSVIAFLIENGADTSIKDDDGMSALDHAKKYKHHKIVNILEL